MLKVLLLALAQAVAAPQASVLRDFDAAAFNAAQRSNGAILIQVDSQYCEACAFQREALDQLANQSSPFKEIVFFKVNGDRPESAGILRALDLPGRGTLILLRGTRDLGRLVGSSQPEEIRRLLEKAIPSGRAGARTIRPKNRVQPRP